MAARFAGGGKRKRFGLFVIFFVVMSMMFACAPRSKYVNVTNKAGETVKMEIRYKSGSSTEIESVTIPGDKLAEKAAPAPKIQGVTAGGCIICYYDPYTGTWRYYPPTCICP